MGDAETDDVKDVFRRHLSKGRASLGEMFGAHIEESSHGAYLYTRAGERFLNCAGYGVFLLGATHPAVVERVVEQVRRHPVSSRVLLDVTAARAAQLLTQRCPPGLSKVHFVGSGAEAVETAIKIGRAHGKRRLITTVNGYHGKTMGALSLTSRAVYQDPFRPLLEDVAEVPYGDVAALDTVLADGKPSLFIVEPVQGEGGVIIPPEGYLREVESVCRERGAMLVVDEVLTGLGRTGSWFESSAQDISPDVLLVGKGLSGGVIPVAAAVATAEAYKPFDNDPFLHTSTFSGAPVAVSAAEAALMALDAEGAIEAAARIGPILLDSLRVSAERHCPSLVTEVRGRGLLIGIEFADPGLAGEMILELVDRHVLVNHSLNNGAVLRLTPPAILDDRQVSEVCSSVDEAFRALATRMEGVSCNR